MRLWWVFVFLAAGSAAGCDPALPIKLVRPDASHPTFCFYRHSGDEHPSVRHFEGVGVWRFEPGHWPPGPAVWRLEGPFSAACIDYGATTAQGLVPDKCGVWSVAPPLEPGRCYIFAAGPDDALTGTLPFCVEKNGKLRVVEER